MAKQQLTKTSDCYPYLVQCLRDSVRVYQQTLLVHWGLMGCNFFAIHKLTQEIYEEMQDGIDSIAEHIRSLDIATPKTVEDLNYSDFTDVPLDDFFDQEKILVQLALNHNTLASKFERLAEMCEQSGDQLTLDLSVERGRLHKKYQWLLKSNIGYKK